MEEEKRSSERSFTIPKKKKVYSWKECSCHVTTEELLLLGPNEQILTEYFLPNCLKIKFGHTIYLKYNKQTQLFCYRYVVPITVIMDVLVYSFESKKPMYLQEEHLI